MCCLASWVRWSNLSRNNLTYRTFLFLFLGGLVGVFALESFLAFFYQRFWHLLCHPKELWLWECSVPGRWNLWASRTHCYAIRWPRRYAMTSAWDWHALCSTLASARAVKTPSIGMWAGSMQTKGGRVWLFSASNLPATTWRNRSAMVMLSHVLTSQTLLWEAVIPQGELTRDLSFSCCFSPWLDWGLRPSLLL